MLNVYGWPFIVNKTFFRRHVGSLQIGQDVTNQARLHPGLQR